MRCDDVRAALSAVLDGEAVLEQAPAAHLSACAECRAWHDEVRELERLFAAPVAVPREVVPRVGRVRPLLRGRSGRVVAVAVLLALPAGTAAARLRDRAERPPARAVEAPPATRAPAARPSATATAPRPTTAAAVTKPAPSRPAAPVETTPPPTTPAAAKPLAAERRDGPLLLRLTAPAAQRGTLTATLTLTNDGPEAVTYDAPCADLLVVVDGEALAADPDPACEAFRTVTLAPGESRDLTVAVNLEPGTYGVSGALLRVPRDGRREGKLDTPPLRVTVT